MGQFSVYYATFISYWKRPLKYIRAFIRWHAFLATGIYFYLLEYLFTAVPLRLFESHTLRAWCFTYVSRIAPAEITGFFTERFFCFILSAPSSRHAFQPYLFIFTRIAAFVRLSYFRADEFLFSHMTLRLFEIYALSRCAAPASSRRWCIIRLILRGAPRRIWWRWCAMSHYALLSLQYSHAEALLLFSVLFAPWCAYISYQKCHIFAIIASPIVEDDTLRAAAHMKIFLGCYRLFFPPYAIVWAIYFPSSRDAIASRQNFRALSALQPLCCYFSLLASRSI